MSRAAKLLLLSLLVTAMVNPAPAQDWIAIPVGTTATLRDLAPSFLGHWVVGDGGFAARSASSTVLTSWEDQDVSTDADLLSAFEVSSDQLWMSGRGGVVRLVVGNPYVVYTNRDIPDASQDYVLFSHDSGRAVALGTLGACYRSDDVGVGWYSLPSGVDVALHRGHGFVAGPAHAVGDGGTILSLDSSVWSPRTSGSRPTCTGSPASAACSPPSARAA